MVESVGGMEAWGGARGRGAPGDAEGKVGPGAGRMG